MPDDLVLNVRQVTQFPPTGTANPSDAILLQRGGLGGPYRYTNPAGIVAPFTDPLSAQLDSLQIEFSSFNQTLADYAAAWTAEFNAAVCQFDASVEQINENTKFLISSIFQNSVRSFNGRRGDVVFTLADMTALGAAPQHNPRFAGIALLNGDPLATVGFMAGKINEQFTLNNMLCLGLAPIDSPPLQGRPTAPTPPQGDSSSRIATTRWGNLRFRAIEQDLDLRFDESLSFLEDHLEEQMIPVIDANIDALLADKNVATEDWVNNLLHGYLPLSGGTLTGSLKIEPTLPRTFFTNPPDIANGSGRAGMEYRVDADCELVAIRTYSLSGMISGMAVTISTGELPTFGPVNDPAMTQQYVFTSISHSSGQWFQWNIPTPIPLKAGDRFIVYTMTSSARTFRFSSFQMPHSNGPLTALRAFALNISGGVSSSYTIINNLTSSGGGFDVVVKETRPVILAGDGVGPLDAVPLQQLQRYLPLKGGTLTGDLFMTNPSSLTRLMMATQTGASSFSLNLYSGGVAGRNGTTGAAKLQGWKGDALSGGAARWELYLGDGATESTGNVGSNFTIKSYADDDAFLDTPLTIGRQSGRTTLKGLTLRDVNQSETGGLGLTLSNSWSWNIGTYAATITTSNLGNGIRVNNNSTNSTCYEATLGTASYYTSIFRAYNNATASCPTYDSLGTGSGPHFRAFATDNTTEVFRIVRSGQVISSTLASTGDAISVTNIGTGSGIYINNSNATNGAAIRINNAATNSYGLQVNGRGIYLDVGTGDNFGLDINHGNNTAGKPCIYLRGANPTEPVLAVWRWQPDTTRRMWINADGSTAINYSGSDVPALDINATGISASFVVRNGAQNHFVIGTDGSVILSTPVIIAMRALLGIA